MALVPIVLAWLVLMCFVLALCRSARAGDLQSCGEEPAGASASEVTVARNPGAPARALPSRGDVAGAPPARVQRFPRRTVRSQQELARPVAARR
jgi:hypothetical protein